MWHGSVLYGFDWNQLSVYVNNILMTRIHGVLDKCLNWSPVPEGESDLHRWKSKLSVIKPKHQVQAPHPDLVAVRRQEVLCGCGQWYSAECLQFTTMANSHKHVREAHVPPDGWKHLIPDWVCLLEASQKLLHIFCQGTVEEFGVKRPPTRHRVHKMTSSDEAQPCVCKPETRTGEARHRR